MKSPSDCATESSALVKQIAPLLSGKDPSVQGACLCELVAMWLAGHDSSLRERLLKLHADTARDMASKFGVMYRGE